MSDGRRVALRYDVSPLVGLGHARRSRSLALALAARGVESLHVAPAAARAALVAEGTPDARLLDAEDTDLTALGEAHGVTHAVLDTLWSGNAANVVRDVAALRAGRVATTVIDSMPPDHYPLAPAGTAPDLLVTPYLGACRRADGGGRRLGGARYAILGPEFGEVRATPPARVPRRVLLSCGGSDDDGLTPLAARALAASGVALDVAIGPLFDERSCAALHALAADTARVRLHRAPSSLATLVAGADLVAGRPGLLRYEAAALGRPGVYLARGAAYREYFERFAAAGLAALYFETDRDGRARFLHALSTLGAGDAPLGDDASPERRSRRDPAARPVDTGGAARVADAILDTRPDPHR